jgi:uncharacterized repeat protein (TIGR01451 family)
MMCAGQVLAQTVVYTNDFETLPVTGWSVNNTDFDNDYTRFLGRFDNSPTETSRTFTLPAGTSRVEVEFDFYRFDSWDNTAQWGFDRLQVDVDGTQIFSLPFSTEQVARSGANGTVDWAHTPLAAATNNAFNLTDRPWYQDQPHRVNLTVNAPGTTLDLTLRTFLNQGGNDESGGFDNVTITAFVDPVVDAVKTVAIEDAMAAPSFAIPGNNAVYTISMTNSGGAMDADSLTIIDSLPEEVILDTSAPILFVDNSTPPSGLSCCTAANVDYSDTVSGPPVFGYVPTSAFDDAVTHVRISPSGTLRDSTVDPTTVSFSFPTRIR